MSNIKSLATMAAATSIFSSAFGAFDASANTNMVVYWGQGPDQPPLSHFCADPNIDIINIGFLNQFPDQTKGLPGTNFGNQCGPETYKNKDGSDSLFLSNCPSIGPDIVTCQNAGKKVLLSLGGAIPSNQTVKDDDSAQAFAQTLWTSFGPKTDASAPRPFGDAVVDGFDFDIESVLVKGEDPADLSRGYSSLINNLRSYFLFQDKTYYISGAPQCVVPDAHLANAIQTSVFDFLFVQFYNTAKCSARSYFDHNYGGQGSDITFSNWVDFVHTFGANKKTKVYLGLPASNDSNDVIDPVMYLQPNEAKEIIQHFQKAYPADFGGVMLYEATASETHPINGKPYADVLKKYLLGEDVLSTSSSVPSSTKATSKVQSSTKASSSAPLFPTIVPTSLPFGLAPPSSSGAPYPSASGSAGSSSAPYPIPSGSSLSAKSSGSSAVVVPSGSVLSKSGTAPYTVKTGTAPYSSKTGTAPYSIKTSAASSASASASASASGGSSGASSGFLPSGSGSSSAPYPTGNSSVPILTGGYSSPTTTSEEEVVTLTSVVTITSCGPEVTNCPAKTHPFVSTETLVSTIHPGSSGSVPAGGASSTGSSPSNSPETSNGLVPQSAPSGAGSTPGNSPQSTQEVVTTAIVTSYLTTCPVTSTTTTSGSQIIETGSTVSTVYSTIVSTICTKCVAPKTESGAYGPSSTAVVIIPGGGHQGPPLPMPAGPSSPVQEATSSTPVGQSESPFTGAPSPSAPIQEVVTTVVEFTTLTTCPVTYTITSGTAEIVQVTHTVSTITSTFISTICTKCVAPPTGTPVPGSGASTPSITPVAVIPGSGHQGPAAPMPAGPSSENHGTGNSSPENSSPAGSSPAGSSPSAPESPSHEVESGAQGGSVPSTPGNTGSSGSSPAPAASSSPAPSTPAPANSPASPESHSGAESQPAAPAGQAFPASSSAAGAKTIQSTVLYHAVKTLTMVPIPVNPSQTAKPMIPIESAEQASGVPSKPAPASGSSNGASSGSGAPGNGVSGSGAPSNSGAQGAPAPAPAPAPGAAAPFPASNGTTPASPTGSASPSQGSTSPSLPSVEAFTGAASRMDAGIFGIVSFVVAAVLLL